MLDPPQTSEVFLLPTWIVLAQAPGWADSVVDWKLEAVLMGDVITFRILEIALRLRRNLRFFTNTLPDFILIRYL